MGGDFLHKRHDQRDMEIDLDIEQGNKNEEREKFKTYLKDGQLFRGAFEFGGQDKGCAGGTEVGAVDDHERAGFIQDASVGKSDGDSRDGGGGLGNKSQCGGSEQTENVGFIGRDHEFEEPMIVSERDGTHLH